LEEEEEEEEEEGGSLLFVSLNEDKEGDEDEGEERFETKFKRPSLEKGGGSFASGNVDDKEAEASERGVSNVSSERRGVVLEDDDERLELMLGFGGGGARLFALRTDAGKVLGWVGSRM
jgi:hypothetical protein